MSTATFIRAGTTWITDHVIEHWPAYVVLFVSGGGATYASRVTRWVNAYGPIAWFASGLGGALLGLCLYSIFVWLRGKKIDQDLARAMAERSGVSPTLPTYEDQRIHLGDFFNPYYVPYKNKVFCRCQIWGPSMVYLQNVTFDHCVFRHVQIVVARPDHNLWGIIWFERPTFIDCEVSNITIAMNRASYDALDEEVRRFLPVINEVAPNQP